MGVDLSRPKPCDRCALSGVISQQKFFFRCFPVFREQCSAIEAFRPRKSTALEVAPMCALTPEIQRVHLRTPAAVGISNLNSDLV